ncbi:MAG: ABC transporter permease [Oscillospiraceae bacterium]|jgi:spermidine/putrescine transport system permease protein|nr:ABC transporter permease [Oscillospiraceae bacterium]MCI1990605.1 ABC transporter permease [Oscillospiraceae bacterium]MCI2035520.1 ABC transporter permease [Oscillospiraceae bacterium]
MSKHKFRASTLPVLATVGPVSLWLAFFVAIPLLYVLVMSFCSIDENYNVVFQFTLANYRNLLDVNYLQIYVQSILIAFFATAFCLVLGYPFAFLISRTFQSRKTILYMMVIIPFWTNSLIRIYGWRTFLGASGWLNRALTALHLIDSPVEFLFNRGATVLGMAYVLFPFMVLPLYTAIEKLDQSQLEVSADLGARGGATFFNVVLPQTVSGVFSGCIMVFIPSLGYFYVADILGGGNSDVIGNLIERQFQSGNNWPLGAALSIILIAVTLLLVKLYQKCGGDMQSLGV